MCLDIEKTIKKSEYQNKPLFISGHSLCGAIATIATKKLKHSAGIAACYTFGAPRVGDMDWAENIKTPIYRIVNAADPVTMLPPSSEVISALSWLLGLVPHVGKKIQAFLISKFGGYYHAGNMRYLTNCKTGDYHDVKLLYSVSWWFRMKAFLKNKVSFLKMPADHSMTVYRNKLKTIAISRNNIA